MHEWRDSRSDLLGEGLEWGLILEKQDGSVARRVPRDLVLVLLHNRRCIQASALHFLSWYECGRTWSLVAEALDVALQHDVPELLVGLAEDHDCAPGLDVEW